MALLKREQVKQAAEKKAGFKTERVPVPEIEEGGEFLIRELTSDEAEFFGFSMMGADGKTDVRLARGKRVEIVRFAVIDEDGERLFSKDDSKWLSELSNDVIQRVSDAILALSGLAREETEEGQPVPNA
jgi:hypothetical protein